MQKLASWNYLTMMKPLGNVHGGYPDNAEWEEVYITYAEEVLARGNTRSR